MPKPPCCRSATPAPRGFTLVEMLIVVSLLAVIASVMVPSVSGNDGQRLDVAAAEVRDALRFSRAEAMRRGKYVLFDTESSPGQVRVMVTSGGCSSLSSFTAATDPRTKAAYVVKVTDGPFSGGVMVTPNFLAGGTAYGGLTFDAEGKPSSVCQVSSKTSKGTPAAGSGVVLSYGDRQVTVAVDPATGRISIL